MTNVCRTCGFSDCPGANGGNCPRWPARDTSDLDTLTRQELYALHNDLFNEHSALNSKLIGPDYKPLVDPLGEFWQEIDAQCREVVAKMARVHALIQVREAERDRHQETVLAESIYRGFGGTDA